MSEQNKNAARYVARELPEARSVAQHESAQRAAPHQVQEGAAPKCKTCDGKGHVPDGEIGFYEGTGIAYENGPVACVKDCPKCGGSGAVQEGGGDALTQAARDVLAERSRQVEKEGWTPEHDDEHGRGEMALAAGAYAVTAATGLELRADEATYAKASSPIRWPWAPRWWKPTNPRRDLVKAAALILAEIERLDRASGIATPPAPIVSAPVGDAWESARREISKWLNEEPNRPVDRQALAVLCAVPPGVARDAATDTERLHWLHSEASNNVDGYEWGIYRVKWQGGKAVEVWQTASDFNDLDAAIRDSNPTSGRGE